MIEGAANVKDLSQCFIMKEVQSGSLVSGIYLGF